MHALRFEAFSSPSYLGKPIFIRGHRLIRFGNGVRIFPHVRLEAFDLGQIVFGNRVKISHNVQITSAEKPLRIGEGTTILANCFITNIDYSFVHSDFGKYTVTDTKIGDNCFVGIGSGILAGTVLGNGCVVGANSLVRGHYPEFTMLAGSPAKVIKIYDIATKTWTKSPSRFDTDCD